MDNKTILKRWTKLCLRQNKTPICLVTVSDDGFPHVFTHHDKDVLDKVFKHLASSGVIVDSTHFDNQEN